MAAAMQGEGVAKTSYLHPTFLFQFQTNIKDLALVQ